MSDDEIFEGNLYWNLSGESSFLAYENLEHWARQTGKESVNGQFAGHFADPMITAFNSKEAGDPAEINPETFRSHLPEPGSPLIDKGLNLKSMLGLDPGARDLPGTTVPQGEQYDIGALEHHE